jgi:PAS domain-containing protein
LKIAARLMIGPLTTKTCAPHPARRLAARRFIRAIRAGELASPALAYAALIVQKGRQKNLILILAREFASKLATPMFVADAAGDLVFYNEPAEAVLGRSFAEAGEMPAETWPSLFSPEDFDGKPLPLKEMPGGIALLERKPAHRDFRITGLDGRRREVSVTAFPLFAHADELVGVVNVFWEQPGAPKP